jgi:MATE family multidrug resistance protein
MRPATTLHRRILALAWPMLLSNITAPLLGLVDTAVLGHLPDPKYLAAVALGSNFFMFLYFSFNFLRMSTTGLVSQSHGAGDNTVVVLARAGLLSLLIGGLLLLLHGPLRELGLSLLGGGAEIQSLARDYINLRIWGAPAALANFALIGFSIGLHNTRIPLVITVVMHSTNALLDLLLVTVLGLDVKGVAVASLVSEYLGLAVGLFLLRHTLARGLREWPAGALKAVAPLLRLLAVNRDIFLRTLALLTVFFFFTAQGARLGETILAANAVLITFMLLLSNALDGFANAAEALVGEAHGRGHRRELDQAVRATGVWSAGMAVVMLAAFLLGGGWLIGLLTDIPAVRETAGTYLPWMAAMTVTAAGCFWLDGVFIGATLARGMRNAMVVATVLGFFPLWWLTRGLDNHGLWLALNGWMLSRTLLMAALWHLWRRQTA